MPAVAKKTTKTLKAKNEGKVTKKSSIKKLQKTAELNAAKKLTKLESKKAVSQKLNVPFVRRQKSKHQFDPIRLKRGVVLLQNIPHGFYEKQLKKYFGQYGDVTRMRLARSEKTGRSKHFAYIEFRYPEVAQIAAESLNNYIMFRQRLRTVYIPPEKQDHDYFKQKVRVAFFDNGKVKRLLTPKLKQAWKTVKEINKPKTAEQIAEINERSKYKLKFLEKKLAKSGINLDLSQQLYSSGSPEEPEQSPQKKTAENGKASKKDAKKNKLKMKEPEPEVVKTTKKSKKNDIVNTTLENLLENTIQTDDESDDDDYEPTPEELAKADEFVSKFLSVETSDDENDTTLNRLLNETIDSDESEEDEDYEPTEAEIAEAEAVKKAMVAAKKLAKINSNDLNAKPLAKKTKINQKKRKVLAEEPSNVPDEAPTKAKKKKMKVKKIVAEPVKVSKAKAKKATKATIEEVKRLKVLKVKPIEKQKKLAKKLPKVAVQPVKKTVKAPPQPAKVDKKSKDTKKMIKQVVVKKKTPESIEPKVSKLKKNVESIPSNLSKKVVKKTPKPDTSPKAKATSLKKKVKTKKN